MSLQPLMQKLSWSLSLQNVTANHRANDVIAAEDGPQVLVGRFMYGPLDMVALTGEKVQRLGIPPLTAHMCTRCLVVPHGTWAEGFGRLSLETPCLGRSGGWGWASQEAGVNLVHLRGQWWLQWGETVVGTRKHPAGPQAPEACFGRELPGRAPKPSLQPPSLSAFPGPLAACRWTSW